MTKQTNKNQTPYTEKTLPKDHPKHGEWNLAGKPTNDLAVKGLNKKNTKGA